MTKHKNFLCLLAIVAILTLFSGLNQVLGANGYAIEWSTIASSSGVVQSASYVVNANAGQSSIGPASSASYQVGAGYWYGVDGEVYAIYLPLIIRG
jgi:hypothetical protein